MPDEPIEPSECEKAQQTVINLLVLLLQTLGAEQSKIDSAIVK